MQCGGAVQWAQYSDNELTNWDLVSKAITNPVYCKVQAIDNGATTLL